MASPQAHPGASPDYGPGSSAPSYAHTPLPPPESPSSSGPVYYDYTENNNGYSDPDDYDDFGSELAPGDNENDADYYPEHTSELTITELLDSCVIPSCSDMFVKLVPIMLVCLAFRLLTLAVQQLTQRLHRRTQGGSQGGWKTDKQANSHSASGSSSSKWPVTSAASVEFWSSQFLHVSSATLGTLIAWQVFEESSILLFFLALIAYALLWILCHVTRTASARRLVGMATVLVTFVFLITCELFVVSPAVWHRIRGSQMMLAMRVISVAFDVSRLGAHSSSTTGTPSSSSTLATSHVTSSPSPASTLVDSSEVPSMASFFGYALQPGLLVFGPWISYADYAYSIAIATRGPRAKEGAKPSKQPKDYGFSWVVKIVNSYLLAWVCFMHSTCLSQWLFPLGLLSPWVAAYRDAQSFRFSHYFVSYLSEVTATLSGLHHSRVGGPLGASGSSASSSGSSSPTGSLHGTGDSSKWDIRVVRPYYVELPRSLVDVVTSWNLPMHYWLKTYVFKEARHLGVFPAVLLTYLASSTLHGINFQLSAVLLSLGVYTYTEFVLRQKLSNIFSACILARPCKTNSCQHRHKATNIYVRLANLAFGALSVFHLAYLGLMFDSSEGESEGYSVWHTLSKWSQLSYLSHWVAAITLICSVIL